MTPRSPSGNPPATGPRTEAGRALLDALTTVRVSGHNLRSDILAIEREAAAATPSLDVERLALALRSTVLSETRWIDRAAPAIAAGLAAEYDRLTEGSESP